MRSLVLLTLVVIPLLAQQQAPAPCLDRPVADRPYTRVRLIAVVQDQTPVRAEYLIRTCGVRVPFNAELEADLKEAGAEEKLIAAVREVALRSAVAVAPVRPAGPKAGDMKVNPKDGLRYAYIPAGTFRMGCATSADGPCQDDEKPAHDVQISNGFWMGQTEVTVTAYKRYVRAGGKARDPRWSGDALPMTDVDWNDAQGYCSWAGMRLPTEAEWEYAARGGKAGARYGEISAIAWYSGTAGGQAHPVGQKAANGFALHDMLGNVWEWTADWYKDKYEGARMERDPQGSSGGDYRVLRGGSWNYDASFVRASGRSRYQPSDRNLLIGFRCIGELPVP
ncbi:MAG: formylglycine-generating enzyme family protein [Bryobacteraceae bacterium]